MSKSATAALLCGATLAAGLFVSSQAVAAAPAFVYDVTVKTNFGTKFKDCFTFQGGTLTISGLGTLVYTSAPTDPKKFYTALTPLATAEQLGETFAFAGFKVGSASDGKLQAVGADEQRDSYRVSGTAVAACAAMPKATTNQYRSAK